jgi:hypothetical protein
LKGAGPDRSAVSLSCRWRLTLRKPGLSAVALPPGKWEGRKEMNNRCHR